MYRAASCSCSREEDVPGGFVLAASCSYSRGSAPSSAPGGASRTEPPLRMSTYAAEGCLLRGWGDIQDGAPAPRECLGRGGFRP